MMLFDVKVTAERVRDGCEHDRTHRSEGICSWHWGESRLIGTSRRDGSTRHRWGRQRSQTECCIHGDNHVLDLVVTSTYVTQVGRLPNFCVYWQRTRGTRQSGMRVLLRSGDDYCLLNDHRAIYIIAQSSSCTRLFEPPTCCIDDSSEQPIPRNNYSSDNHSTWTGAEKYLHPGCLYYDSTAVRCCDDHHGRSRMQCRTLIDDI